MSHVKRLTQDRPPGGCIFMKSSGTVATVRVSEHCWVFGPKIISVQLCKYYRYSHGSTLTAPQGYYSLTGMLMLMHFVEYFTPADSFCTALIMATYLAKYIQYWITSSMSLLLTPWAVFTASPQLTPVTEPDLSAEFAGVATFWRVSVKISDT